ncbi:MAG TPA: GNAT family protein [Holophagaceae bacterium]|nr:GNAT family protein [Holophagaceae bacterium]
MSASLRAGRDLELRPLALADAPALFAQVDANRARLRQWLPWLDLNTRATHTRAFIADRKALDAKGLARTYTLRVRGELVGMIGFNWIDQQNRSAMVGYWIAEGFEGQGLVTRAVSRLVAHGFRELGLHRIEIRVAVRNRRSRAIPARLGFRHEGTLHDAEWLYDHYVDHAVYAVLESEWPG